MPSLQDAVGAQQAALSTLTRMVESTVSWHDDQRVQLDRDRIGPLLHDGGRLLEVLRRTAEQVAAAERQLG